MPESIISLKTRHNLIENILHKVLNFPQKNVGFNLK